MHLSINGIGLTIAGPCSLGLLMDLLAEGAGIVPDAATVDSRPVARSEWEDFVVLDNARVEVWGAKSQPSRFRDS